MSLFENNKVLIALIGAISILIIALLIGFSVFNSGNATQDTGSISGFMK